MQRNIMKFHDICLYNNNIDNYDNRLILLWMSSNELIQIRKFLKVCSDLFYINIIVAELIKTPVH